MATRYRLITGPDTSEFCARVTAALAEGWSLYGNPVYAADQESGQMRCGQAVIRDEKSDAAASED